MQPKRKSQYRIKKQTIRHRFSFKKTKKLHTKKSGQIFKTNHDNKKSMRQHCKKIERNKKKTKPYRIL